MTLRLVVDTAAWHRHVSDVAASMHGLVPVVKGNGYGFGRRELAVRACRIADTIAVGTVHELADVADAAAAADCDVVVLTPTLAAPIDDAPVLTVGSAAHVDALAGWSGRVIVKLESSLRRYGGDLSLVDHARAAGLDVVGVAVHPPIDGTEEDHVAEVSRWLPSVPADLSVWVSHLDPGSVVALPPTHRYRLRVGTALWHGDKSMLHLDAQVLDTRLVQRGERIGYRQVEMAAGGTVLMVGAGTAHGVHPLPGDRSPFHFARRRLALVEPPHMHTSMAFVPAGDPTPAVGERVDVQHPLTTTWVDVVVWR